jgi:DNA-binding SARP family transcriptional activator
VAHLALSFLGTFKVTFDQRPITHFRSVNVQGLLVYLALQSDRAISRDVLAALLWPDEPDSVAKKNMRQTN